MPLNNPSQKYTYELRVRSLDHTRPVSKVVDDMSGFVNDMTSHLGEFGSELRITVKREEAVPLDPLTAIVLIEVANVTLKPLLEGFFHKLGEKMAESFSSGVDNAQIVVAKEPPDGPERPKPDEP